MACAEVVFYPEFFSLGESDALFDELVKNIAWRQEIINVYGKKVNFPRLTAWYGDEGRSYTYSGTTFHPSPWTPTLLKIKQRIEPVSDALFNSVLLNYYRNGQDSVSWHSDDEPELGRNPLIAAVSLGATRSFQFKRKGKASGRKTIALTHGSLLLMCGPTQHYWLHQIPKSKKCHTGRINLTFRVIQ